MMSVYPASLLILMIKNRWITSTASEKCFFPYFVHRFSQFFSFMTVNYLILGGGGGGGGNRHADIYSENFEFSTCPKCQKCRKK